MTNSFILNILATEDSTQNIPVNRGINVSIDGNISEYVAYQVVNGASALFMPATIAYQLYVRNLSPANPITVSVTPTGNPVAIVTQLQPGGKDFLLICNTPGGGAGFSAVGVTSAGAAAFEYFIGA